MTLALAVNITAFLANLAYAMFIVFDDEDYERANYHLLLAVLSFLAFMGIMFHYNR